MNCTGKRGALECRSIYRKLNVGSVPFSGHEIPGSRGERTCPCHRCQSRSICAYAKAQPTIAVAIHQPLNITWANYALLEQSFKVASRSGRKLYPERKGE